MICFGLNLKISELAAGRPCCLYLDRGLHLPSCLPRFFFLLTSTYLYRTRALLRTSELGIDDLGFSGNTHNYNEVSELSSSQLIIPMVVECVVERKGLVVTHEFCPDRPYLELQIPNDARAVEYIECTFLGRDQGE